VRRSFWSDEIPPNRPQSPSSRLLKRAECQAKSVAAAHSAGDSSMLVRRLRPRPACRWRGQADVHSRFRSRTNRKTWDWFPTGKNQTDCVRAVEAATTAGGMPNDLVALPGAFGDQLDSTSHYAENGYKSKWTVQHGSTRGA
jgi:hypothetical protein